MDLQGSLVDTALRIYPSEKLLNFLREQGFKDTVPTNVGKIVIKEDYKPKGDIPKTKPAKLNISNKDIELINKISSLLDEKDIENDDNNEDKENATPNVDHKLVKDTDSKSKLNDSDTVDVIEDEEKEKTEGPYLTTSDIEWLYEYLAQRRKNDSVVPYLHELIEGSQVEVPPNQVLKRNPDLEARCVKLRAQQEAREYRKMTKGVDNVRMRFPEDSISYQLKQMNRQLIAIGQFIISIFAGFLFGFRGVEWMVGNLDFGFRLLLGVMCALVIALAEIYFLAKKLNEELSIPETTQLGGPPKFADEKLYPDAVKRSIDKPHQD